MRMDPKHQFAAQYVLSRAAAERRERELLTGSSLGKQFTICPKYSNPNRFSYQILSYSQKLAIFMILKAHKLKMFNLGIFNSFLTTWI